MRETIATPLCNVSHRAAAFDTLRYFPPSMRHCASMIIDIYLGRSINPTDRQTGRQPKPQPLTRLRSSSCWSSSDKASTTIGANRLFWEDMSFEFNAVPAHLISTSFACSKPYPKCGQVRVSYRRLPDDLLLVATQVH